ncbi:hypothetical protein MKZ38_003771 [Zalerion maritima]|uniref:Uncharacterized protein n=1 Tax=Zalerion maritima TaxID=339359 RepID=A0AAD5RMF3_9PEZI|nr:hypothetical protein MKZ38_003771 [Zalerion maritima]
MIPPKSPWWVPSTLQNRRIDWEKEESVKTMSDTLQNEYDELFDPKFCSPLYAGFKLNSHGYMVRVDPRDVKILREKDMETPDLSGVTRLQDIGKVGNVSDISKIPIERIWPDQWQAPPADGVTEQVADVVLPSTKCDKNGEHTPRGGAWRDMGHFLQDVVEYDDPCQGAVGDSWLIAALSAVAWSMPQEIQHRTRPTGTSDRDHVSQIKFHSKGGSRDAPHPDDRGPRPRHRAQVQRARDAFAKWLTGNKTDKPSIACLAGGDPIKAMAQITNLDPHYYKTIYPMCAWTHATGGGDDPFTGSDIAASHAYTILGWAERGRDMYIPYNTSFWQPINLINPDGVLALEIHAFRKHFSYIGVAR